MKEIFEDDYYVFSWPNGSKSTVLIPCIKGKWNNPYLLSYSKGIPQWMLECSDNSPDQWEPGYQYRPATEDEINRYKICKEFDRYVEEGYYEVRYSGKNKSIHGSYYLKISECGEALSKGVFVSKSEDYRKYISGTTENIADWRCSDRELIPMSENRIGWFNKCLEEDKVLDFPLKKMSESERQVAEGKIVLGKIYWNGRAWCIPEETSESENFGGSYIFANWNFSKYAGSKNSFSLDMAKTEEITKDHEDYNWIKYCFDNEINIDKEEWEKLMSLKVEIGKVYEITYESGIGKCLVLVNRCYDRSFYGDYFHSLGSLPIYSIDGFWIFDEVTVKLVEDQEYWLENFKNKEFKYKYADVVYDLESMDYAPLTQLADIFFWDSSPQGYDYWRRINKEGHTEESEYYLSQMKDQYERSQKRLNDQIPQETRSWLGKDMTIDQLHAKLVSSNERDFESLDVISRRDSEIQSLKQEISELSNKLNAQKPKNNLVSWIRKIV